ncbi:UDP-glucose dehydrogenase family protein [Caloranaerobacter ferrireducens]|uniref:UDP-glucose dehydrogenase family protein n=1 Tax=Caloranaerobacter ferrireducens TaxID=1323370 RepID=UPI00084DC9C6|nr:UDP-glucose/GDP-mannose dehydrogenase family protein [Caloranaerobacter ferrireducens]
MNVSVIGAGYVGLVSALGFCKMNNNVICVDKKIEKITKLNRGIPTLYEEGLEELLKECLQSRNIMFTDDIRIAVEKSDVIFITVGTPTLENWEVDLSQLNEVIREICKYIKSYKVIVNKSTVPVGTQKYIKQLLVDKGVNEENFDVVSNPEFLREGKAIYDFLNADRIVIGLDSERARKIMEKLYKPFNIEIIFTTPETAELIKYASNAFLATKISFINEVANLCDKVGADIEVISYAMGLDKRISPEFLKAGIGFGGSCFPKDTKALVKIAEKYGCNFKIVKSAIEVNNNQRILPVKILLNYYKKLEGKVITVLGLTFKPDTDDIREAPSLYIIRRLLDMKAVVKCYDPKASDEIKKIFPDINCYPNIYDSLEGSSCAIICTEWKEISSMNLEKAKLKMKEPIIIDGRNALDLNKVRDSGIIYFSIGRKRQNLKL